jgi:hypothetical protein
MIIKEFKHMPKSPKQIVDEIKCLLDQLISMRPPPAHHTKSSLTSPQLRDKKGASGALSILVQEEFFDSPKDISAVMSKLKEMGRYYSLSLISMNLLNLTKPPRRVLTRFKDSKTKKWQYVVRR